jgi:hypothetical protein
MKPISSFVVPVALAALVLAAATSEAQDGLNGRYVRVQGAAVHGFAGNTEIAYQWYPDPKEAEREAEKMRKLLGTGDIPIYDKVEVRPETRTVFIPRPREPMPAPPPPPTPPRPGVPQPEAPATVKLEGQPWIGSETLQGYGRLEFRFLPGNRVQMIDARETVAGSWYQSGNSVSLIFFDGACVYSGTIQGNRISGNALANKTRFSWSVSR